MFKVLLSATLLFLVFFGTGNSGPLLNGNVSKQFARQMVSLVD
jgi:hypothetical protein